LSILQDVTTIVAHQLERDPAELSETADLEDEGLTSIDMIEMIFALEDKFRIDLQYNANESDAQRKRTIGDIVELVEAAIARCHAE